MLTRNQYQSAKTRAGELLIQSGIVVSEKEIDAMDIVDFGLSNLEKEGAQIISLFETQKVAARVIVLFPWQAEPEHWHIGQNNYAGKEETIRVISGRLLVYVEGEDTFAYGKIPEGKEAYYTSRHELLLGPCDTVTFMPKAKHWFQAMDEPCVFYTMSTLALDALDPFSDPDVVRKTKIIEA